MLMTGGVMVVFTFVVSDMVMLVTGVNGGVMVVFVLVFGDVVMHVTGVTCGVMVVFDDVVGDIVMLLTRVNGGVMMLFVDVVMPVTGVTDSVMVVMVMYVIGSNPWRQPCRCRQWRCHGGDVLVVIYTESFSLSYSAHSCARRLGHRRQEWYGGLSAHRLCAKACERRRQAL
jgi:hypothetical protein